MGRKTRKRFTCEACGADAGEVGVACDQCHLARLKRLLANKVWRGLAAARKGDLPGENLLDTIRREADWLAEAIDHDTNVWR